MDMMNTLAELVSAFGPSGAEKGVASVIEKVAAQYCDEVSRDTMGNLICHKKGCGPKVMFAAHMDSIGLVATHIDEKGFVHVGAIGGVAPKEVLYTPVRFQNGTCGMIGAAEDADAAKLKMSDLFIDIGAAGREEAERLVRVGDVAVYNTQTVDACGRVISPYLDNRVSCLVLLMAMEKLGQVENDLYFVFTSQEEVGIRGAKTAAWAIDPDYGIAVDVTASDDEPGSKHLVSSVFGGGAAVKVMDSSVICHPQMVDKLMSLAEEKGIKAQRDVIRAGGTDAGAIHLTRAGVYTGGISIPCRYIHTPTEMVDKGDVKACADLVAAFALAELEQV
jgi:endoglucanase